MKKPENKNSKDSKKYTQAEKISNWVETGGGFLKIGHKPGGKNRSLPSLLNEGTTTIMTILSERENAKEIGDFCVANNLGWIWLSLPNGDIPPKKRNSEIVDIFKLLKNKLSNKEKIYIHCAAGMHRTGMITNAFLLFSGYDEKTAYDLLYQLRPITALEVGEKRLKWGAEFSDNNKPLNT